jgi:RNA polymerase sigma-70 factor (ECF subfamily)
MALIGFPKNNVQKLRVPDLERASMSFSPQAVDSTEAFLQFLNQVERGLNLYVHSLVSSNSDARDLLQEVRITLWKNFAAFEPGTNPMAWARRIALHRILNYRRSEKRRSAFSADPEFLEAVAGEIERQSRDLDSRADRLHECLRKLPDAHRKLILLRYFDECGVDEIAQKTERTVEAVYRLVSRVRVVLQECMEKPREAAPGA